MKIERICNEPDMIAAGGGYVLTASMGSARLEENRVINVLIEMMFSLAEKGEVSDALANAHGCIMQTDHMNARNYVYIPDDEFALRSIPLEDR